MASFPTSVKTFATRTSGQTIDPAHVNDLQDEVNAIEDGYLNATARLNSSNSTLANLSVTGGSTFRGGLNSSNSTLAALSVSGGSTLAGGLNSSNSTVAELSVTSSTLTISTQTYIFPAARPSTGNVLTAESTSGSTTTLKWAAAAAGSRVACRLTHNSTRTLSSGVFTGLSWNTETFASAGMHSTTTNSSRLTIPSSGVYLFGANLADETGPDRLIAHIRLNDTSTLIQVASGALSSQGVDLTMIYDLSTSDYLTVRAQITAGAAGSVSTTVTAFWAVKVLG